MTDLHEVSFQWPAGPYKVILTGEFDNWSRTTELTKTENGFTGVFHLPWDKKVPYKYIVDGQWRVDTTKPQEADRAGNINNVYTSPAKPFVDAPQPPPPTAVKGNAASIVSYMASGLGAAFASVTGIDPINPKQIPIEEGKVDDTSAAKTTPELDATKAQPSATPDVPHDLPIPEAATEAKTPASVEAATVKEDVPTSTEETKEMASSTGVAIPDAAEPHKEAAAVDPIPTPDAVEPCKETEVTPPGETLAAPHETLDATDTTRGTATSYPDTATLVPSKASDGVDKSKDSMDAKKARHSIAGSTLVDGTLKRKKRHSILGKLKEIFTPEKQKKTKASSSSSS